jgi:hypothetical protein
LIGAKPYQLFDEPFLVQGLVLRDEAQTEKYPPFFPPSAEPERGVDIFGFPKNMFTLPSQPMVISNSLMVGVFQHIVEFKEGPTHM